MRKTIREWANLCSDDTIRKKWIENADKDDWADWHNNTMQASMGDALFESFGWATSPQGLEYWKEIMIDMDENPEKYLKKRKVMFHEDNG